MKHDTKAAAIFIDTLPEEERRYVIEMVYRVGGVEPPPPPKSRDLLLRRGKTIHDDLANVIDLAQRRASGGEP